STTRASGGMCFCQGRVRRRYTKSRARGVELDRRLSDPTSRFQAMTGALKIYSGRNRPDLAPVYRLFEQLTDTTVEVEKVYHWNVENRVVDERTDPQADILLTNSQLALQLIQTANIFEPYEAPIAREYAE